MVYTYHGDVNIEYGGIFLDFDEFEKWGDYIPAIKVTNLCSAIGFTGAIMIETGSIYIPEGDKERQSALDCIGADLKTATPLELAEAFNAYHGVERETYGGLITIQTDPDGDMSFNGWDIDKEESEKFRESGESLYDWIVNNWGGEFESITPVQALQDVIGMAEGWIRDQLEGTGNFESALKELEPYKKVLCRMKEESDSV